MGSVGVAQGGTRRAIFSAEVSDRISGLTSLTEPTPGANVSAVVDVAVIGARGDGKTQFLMHAIRTLLAKGPPDLSGTEEAYNRSIGRVVMNPAEPRPEATRPGLIPHYTFRIRPRILFNGVGFGGQLSLLARSGGLWRYWLLALVNAAVVAGVLFWLRGSADILAPLAAGGLALFGVCVGFVFARRGFVRQGDVEVVFWDIAGEDAYSSTASDYHEFLRALVNERRRHGGKNRGYGFAPVLLCNPMSLGTHPEGSPYAKLRELLPVFASVDEASSGALIAINRWQVVSHLCQRGRDREELVGVVPVARAVQHRSADTDSAASLSIVKRDVIRKHCIDAEDSSEDGVYVRHFRYDAGVRVDCTHEPWAEWKRQVAADPPDEPQQPLPEEPEEVVTYSYEEGPRLFKGRLRRAFFRWLSQLAFQGATTEDHLEVWAPTPAVGAASRDVDAASRDVDAASRDVDAASRDVDAASRDVDAASREVPPQARPDTPGDWSKEDGTSPGVGDSRRPRPNKRTKRLGSIDPDDDGSTTTGGFRSGGT